MGLVGYIVVFVVVFVVAALLGLLTLGLVLMIRALRRP